MNTVIIGREQEQAMLAEMEAAVATDMLAITGRRRVGKTWLVKTYFEGRMHFEFSGVLNAGNEAQLQSFTIALSKYSGKKIKTRPTNWMEAFELLATHLEKIKRSKKLLVFIDELPWLDNHKSGFLAGLEWFWNSWAYGRNILFIICGSATSWMQSKIINNRGGLHNRVTKRMHLQPFNLTETEAFLRHKGITLSRYDIVQLYMALGGIPHYLKEIKKGQSAAQNINRICFEKNGLLVNEFDNLYHALFTDARQHISIIQALASKHKGLSRAEILKVTQLKDGGTFSKLLQELEQSNFISVSYPYGKVKKEALYRLVDEFSLFYLRFIHKKKNINWQQLSASPAYKTWSGYAFENICFKHINKIKAALGIRAVYTEQSSFYYKGSTHEPGTQIDLLIDRNDNVINICEVKFYDRPFSLDKKYADDLRNTMRIFKERSKTKKSLFLTFITSFGLAPNIHSIGYVQQELTMESLF
ncbi:MAG TPA: ATP-binding protein [Ferruginibacter sp.]|nr:ATP-binding protein [Ferruginibacter sp.]HMP20763.1 ATP-binding protein [Ferruginibacter sp.]